ncbi:TRAP transporter small permease subunit [Stappia sp. GBMRC 2046]|uniref:TRAP transporter small permease protein n=1 Tax=Stappia sediminis TaxID=2692190 RepID=A0A7X3S8G9_9HYPH|nr:TRAP transporter small permease [Stappia sediminis]MXN65818.1 TRAP transporter small permease subunit [Stappia sediminis]
MSLYIRLVTALSRLGGVFAILLTASAALVVTQMVFMRYVLNASTVWQTEYVIYALVAATFIGSPYVLLEKGHVNVDLLQTGAPENVKRTMKLLSGLVGIAFCALLAYSGWMYFHEAWEGGWRTETVWAIPLWIPLLPLPLGIGLLVLQYIAEIMKLFGEDA